MLPHQFRDNAPCQLGSSYEMRTTPFSLGNIILLKEKGGMRGCDRDAFPHKAQSIYILLPSTENVC